MYDAQSYAQVPLYIPDDTQMEVNMWRQTDGYKVWYEWVVGSHKVDTGRSGHDLRFNVGELQSGHKNGYIM